MMSLRNGVWTSFPNDDQIRREANRVYWKFVCPRCGGAASGQHIGDSEFHINRVHCVTCGWEWIDPNLSTENKLKHTGQTTLEDE